MKNRTLQNRDQRLEIRIDLAVAAKIICLANFELWKRQIQSNDFVEINDKNTDFTCFVDE